MNDNIKKLKRTLKNSRKKPTKLRLALHFHKEEVLKQAEKEKKLAAQKEIKEEKKIERKPLDSESEYYTVEECDGEDRTFTFRTQGQPAASNTPSKQQIQPGQQEAEVNQPGRVSHDPKIPATFLSQEDKASSEPKKKDNNSKEPQRTVSRQSSQRKPEILVNKRSNLKEEVAKVKKMKLHVSPLVEEFNIVKQEGRAPKVYFYSLTLRE